MASRGVATPISYPIKQPFVNQPIWHLVDATGHRVGRLANQISRLILGKHKPIYNPAADTGDYVVVTNCDKILFTGKKWLHKLYRYHTGYPGGLREIQAKDMMYKKPDSILRRAVNGMLPKNNLRKQRLRKLRIFVGENHPHLLQFPPSLQANFVKAVSRIRPDKNELTLEEWELMAEEIEIARQDPQAYIKKKGATTFEVEPNPGPEGGHQLVIKSFEPENVLHRSGHEKLETLMKRLKRTEKLRRIVEGIHKDIKQRKITRDPLHL